jgi:hypothetical protein
MAIKKKQDPKLKLKDTIEVIWKQGPRGFFKGYGLHMVTIMPFLTIDVVIYDVSTLYLFLMMI